MKAYNEVTDADYAQLNKNKKAKALCKRDKRRFLLSKVDPSASSKEQWAGLKELRQEIQPQLYARNDRFWKNAE